MGFIRRDAILSQKPNGRPQGSPLHVFADDGWWDSIRSIMLMDKGGGKVQTLKFTFPIQIDFEWGGREIFGYKGY
jgi:hypothetical protein